MSGVYKKNLMEFLYIWMFLYNIEKSDAWEEISCFLILKIFRVVRDNTPGWASSAGWSQCVPYEHYMEGVVPRFMWSGASFSGEADLTVREGKADGTVSMLLLYSEESSSTS